MYDYTIYPLLLNTCFLWEPPPINIILQLGFKLAGEVSRRRQDLDVGEGTKIHLDEIDGRPDEHYAKIESTLIDNDSVTEVRIDLLKTFETLGETDIIETPYFEL